jgi:hypothetical protein
MADVNISFSFNVPYGILTLKGPLESPLTSVFWNGVRTAWSTSRTFTVTVTPRLPVTGSGSGPTMFTGAEPGKGFCATACREFMSKP